MGSCNSTNNSKKSGSLNIRQSTEPGKLFIIPNLTQECKVVIIGDTGVGKSSIAVRFLQNKFSDQHVVTIGAQFQQTKIVLKNGVNLKMNLWDTAGEDKFRSMIPIYYKHAKAAMLVYDVSNLKSFQDLGYWVNELEDKTKKEELLLVLIGNKCDVEPTKRCVEAIDGQNYANQNNMLFFEVSAKTGFNINEMFKRMAEEIYKMMGMRRGVK